MSSKIANIENGLERMTDAWNHYFLENKFCQSKINYNDEVKTNYYGDILSYFNDTLSFLYVNQAHLGRKESVFNSISLLQIVYAQQDLMDELLYIFKLPASSKEDKNPNRSIRNELIGHPIRRLNDELISSVFFGNEFRGNIIHYIIYSKDNGFKLEEKIMSVEKIIERHLDFLIKYIGIIISKIKIILNHLVKKINVILSMLNGNVNFLNLLTFIGHVYEKVFEDNRLFEPKLLKKIYKKIDNHPRYSNAINIFYDTVRSYTEDAKKSIDSIASSKVIQVEDVVVPRITFKIIKLKNAHAKMPAERRYFDYEFSKLFEKHPIYEINYFIERFSSDTLIMEELQNMKKFIGDDLEYYSSYEYLRVLMTEKGLLNRRF